MSNLSYYEMRVEMSKVARLMWERHLTNAAGSNFAARVDENRILISPSMMSEHRHREMCPEDFLLIDYDENILEGTGKLSREVRMHMLMKYRYCVELLEQAVGRGYDSIISIISRQRFNPSGLTIRQPRFSIRKPLDLWITASKSSARSLLCGTA